MLTLRPTQKFARRLGLPIVKIAPPVPDRLNDWCVEDFLAGRRRYLLFAHTVSLFPVVTRARGVRDTPTLVASLQQSLGDLLAEEPGYEKALDTLAAVEDEVQFAPIPSRSFLGSTNDFRRLAYFHLVEDGFSPEVCSRWLAEAPMSFLGMNSPYRVFAKLHGQPEESLRWTR